MTETARDLINKLHEWHRAQAALPYPVVIEPQCRATGCEADVLRARIARLEGEAAGLRGELAGVALMDAEGDAVLPEVVRQLQAENAALKNAMLHPTPDMVSNALEELGIYPAAFVGTYDKRTEFMEGWNAALIEIGKQLAVLERKSKPPAPEEKNDG